MRVILFLLKCLVGLFATIGFLVVAGVAALAVLLWQLEPFTWQPREVTVPKRAVLTLDLTQGVIETRPDNPLARASLRDVVVLRDTVEALDAAAGDARVVGLVARVGRGGLGLADIQELRDAVGRFRESGKFALAFAESFGEGGNGTLHYYLASAFEEVWLQPSGDFAVTGLSLESPYLRAALEEIGVEPQFDQRREYKSAVSFLTESAMPAPQRENLQRLVESWFEQILRGIAETRGLEPASLRPLIDNAPFLAEQALAVGLVDKLGYRDQLDDAVGERAGTNAEQLALADYGAARGKAPPKGPVIALIHGLGPVVLDGGENDPLFGRMTMGSDTVADAISRAIADPQVEAIVFRVDSPGGSYVASDVIWREVQRAREAGVPLIVSMGNIAASGGYFVAAPAHKIVAQPGTLTGSIGVAAGKLVLQELWDNLGITWEGVRTGDNAGLWSPNERFTPDGWQHLQRFLDAAYADFTAKVAAGRGLDPATAERAAQGQVWTGEDAQAQGLVDALGGYATALALAREAAGIAPEAPVQFRPYPPRRDPFKALFEDLLGASAQSPSVAALARGLARLAHALAPLVEAVDRVTADPRSRSLQAPPLRLGQ
ncbi:MAG: S49 family peptidase [Kiloniellales bacterium]